MLENQGLVIDKPKSGLIARLKKINRLFLVTVVVPTAVSVLYFGAIASDVYISESRFVVRNAQKQQQSSSLGALLAGAGVSAGSGDAFPVIDYIKSRDALAALNKDGYILSAFGRQGDIFNRFPGILRDDSFESLYRYYDKRIVDVEQDAASGIVTLEVRGFDADHAKALNERLLGLSEQLVNQMNSRAAEDAVKLSEQQVDKATSRAKDAMVALSDYRNTHAVFDPDKQSALQLQQVAALQEKLFSAQNQLVQVETVSPANPQVASLKSEIAVLQKQIDLSVGGGVGNKSSLSGKAVDYERLQLDAQFAEKQLASATSTLELASVEAQRQQLYLERIVQPNAPDMALEPHRIRNIFATLILGLIAWGILSLFIAGVKEHRD